MAYFHIVSCVAVGRIVDHIVSSGFVGRIGFGLPVLFGRSYDRDPCYRRIYPLCLIVWCQLGGLSCMCHLDRSLCLRTLCINGCGRICSVLGYILIHGLCHIWCRVCRAWGGNGHILFLLCHVDIFSPSIEGILQRLVSDVVVSRLGCFVSVFHYLDYLLLVW